MIWHHGTTVQVILNAFSAKITQSKFYQGTFSTGCHKESHDEVQMYEYPYYATTLLTNFFTHNYTLVKIYQRIYSSHRSLQTGQSPWACMSSSLQMRISYFWKHEPITSSHMATGLFMHVTIQSKDICATMPLPRCSLSPIHCLSHLLAQTRSGCFDTTGIPSPFITPYPNTDSTSRKLKAGRWLQNNATLCLTRLGTVFNLIKGEKIKVDSVHTRKAYRRE